MSKITKELLIVVAFSLVLFVVDTKSTTSRLLDLRANHTCSTIATFPSNFCSDPATCSLITHTFGAGSTYIVERSRHTLLVFPPNGQNPQWYSLADLPPIDDFTVLNNGIIAVISSSAIYKYDLATDIGKRLFPSRSFMDCSINDLRQKTAFTVLQGSNSVAACYTKVDTEGKLASYQIYYGITLLDLNVETSQDLLKFGGVRGGWRPWSVSLFGQDSRLYVSGMEVDAPLQRQLLVFDTGNIQDLQNPSMPTGYSAIATRYDPRISKWDFVPISNNVGVQLGRLYEVDSSGNMYFIDFSPQYRITCINNTGNVDWVLTEQDLGSRPYFAGLAPDGKLRLVERPTSTSQGQIKECSVDMKATSTAIPSLRATP